MIMGMNMKMRFRRLHWQEWVIFFFVPPLLFSGPARAGDYLQSAHGSNSYGVSRPVMATAGYAQGNCANCHEQHASLNGTEPAPAGGAAPYTLFTRNFNTSATTGGPYSESDDFCFYCHNSSASVQVVQNNDYSQVFGGSTTQGPLDILAAFNQTSHHNLYDVWNFVDNNTAFPWFTSYSNPCNACHNPHKARRNRSAPKDVTLSVMSRPSDHFALWGTTAAQTMDGVYGTQYEPPYSTNPSYREPATSADAATGRANTPDYVALCTDCHNSTNTIYSTTLGRNLLQIDWRSTGDQHGAAASSGTRVLKSPFSSGTNYVLSCLNCHEPHGSSNITLLRRRVNGGDLAVVGAITTPLPKPPGTGTNNSNRELGYLCMQCHQQDSNTGTSTTNPPKWENVHHFVTNHPYFQRGGPCWRCHGSPWPIACDKCHFHGGTDAWFGSRATGRKTF